MNPNNPVPNQKLATPKSSVNLANTTTKPKGNVSFSSTELSSDDAMPVTNKPKLLIDGVDNGKQLSNVHKFKRSTRRHTKQLKPV